MASQVGVDSDRDDLGPPETRSIRITQALIAELCDACQEYAQRAVGVGLDQTPDTLPILDHYLEVARGGVRERPELLAVVARAAGAYFGEVVRTAIDGFWVGVGADDHRWRVCGRRAFLSFNPVGIVHEAIARSAEHGGPSGELRLAPEDRESVKNRLDALPPVAQEDYFLLATRFDAIETVHEALLGDLVQGGASDVFFEPSDYEDEPD